MGTIVLDAGIVIALFDPYDALHSSSADAVRRHRDSVDRFVVPASVFAEILVSAARRGENEVAERRRLVTAAFGTPHPVDEAVAVAAATRRARHRSLRLPDALLLAVADVLGAQAILTGDKRWQDVDPRVELIE